jgi:adenylosuccinate synthase
MDGKVTVVVGGQYGSEGKGVIVAYLADRYDVHVRVGGPNAGHSFFSSGKVWKMQVIPCGWKNPNANLVLGRGMLINPEILMREIEMIEEFDPLIRTRLFVDSKAGILSEEFVQQENHTKGAIHKRIGSTGEGVGAAREARVSRGRVPFKLFEDIAEEYGLKSIMVDDTPTLIENWRKEGKDIMVEGTQGSALSMIHGPYPFVTSHDTNAAQMIADIGISPLNVTDIILVCRSYPIRVAGNSGPLKNETNWMEISKKFDREVIERTTVTKKVRRVGEWDEELVRQAVVLNAPTALAFTFADYVNPGDEGVCRYEGLSKETKDFVKYLEKTFKTPVVFVGTGAEDNDWQVVERKILK